MMGAIIVIVGFALVIAMASYSAGRWRKTLAHVARRYGLQMTNGGLLRATSVHGALDGVPITVDTFSQGSGKSRTTYSRVAMAPRMPDGLALKKEGSFLGKIFKGDDLETGDPFFDGRVIARGPSRALRALLDGPTRAAVIAGVGQGIEVDDGAIKWVKRGHADSEALCGAIDAVADLAQRLSRPADTNALADVVRTDDAAVALHALHAMPAGEVRDALDVEIVETRDDAFVMSAAPRVGASAAPGVLKVLENPHNSDGLRANALSWLGANTDAIALAQQHLTRPIIAAAALKILARSDVVLPLEILARLLDADATIAPDALRAARRHGVGAEAFLIEALAHESDAVARAAADSLGLVGTPAAVMPLRSRIKGLFVDGDLKSAALAAIERIQGRVGTVGGGLSVVESSAAGRLSETE